jgi:hypothetical protein
MTNEVNKIEQTGPAAGERKYYTIETDFTLSSAPVREWINKREQMKDFYPDSSKPFGGIRFSEPPQIRFDRKGHRGALSDADPITLGIWLISDRVKPVFERLDRDACVFLRVNIDYSNFPQPGPDYWFCYFIRELDCVDEERSAIAYYDNVPGIKAYENLADVKMKPAAVGSAHAFRLKYAKMKLVVDDVVVDAMTAEKIRGFKFKPIQKQ